MPTTGNTDNLSKEDRERVAVADQAHAAFLQVCNAADVAEMQRRQLIGLLADAGSETPNQAKLAGMLRQAIEIQGGAVPGGSPVSVDEQKETAEALEKRGGADKVAYSDQAVAYGPKADR